MASRIFKAAGIIRTGFEYQDLIGIDLLIKFYREPDRYLWVELESEDESAEYLDDIVAARSDGSFEFIQVKFTVNPTEHRLDWQWLLAKRPNGTSLLEKWARSLDAVSKLGPVHSARLRTNRIPTQRFEACLMDGFINFDSIDEADRPLVEVELGGEHRARAFFRHFQFSHSEPLIDHLENTLRSALVPTDTTSEGWLTLREQARRWATRKREPQPDGKITHQHLVQIITKRRAQPISQDFLVPDGYSPPSNEFHANFNEQVLRKRGRPIILWGTPGRGKSTYLSYAVDALQKSDIPVIRHHYFLSLDDTTNDRLSFPDIATSLMDQMIVRYPEAVTGLEEEHNNLRKWIEACGAHFAKKGKRFVVVVDGLDHVWREQGNIAQMEQLFAYLLPCPANVTLVVGTQRVPDNQLPFRLIQNAIEDSWIEIPPMSLGAVQTWIRGQNVAGRIRLREYTHATNTEEQLGEIGEAFFEISQGHPLHLIYSFEALVRRGTLFSPDEIRLLPTCPDGDIRRYYQGLWGRLSPTAKLIIHLIAGSDFHWPPLGIRRCAGPPDEVDHLLEYRRSGVIPFHGSILAFAREQLDHTASFQSLLPGIVEWLRAEAPEYWRWGWLWLMQAKNGDYAPLVKGTVRAWVVGSLSRGWPPKQIIAILAEAERKAFADRDYSRTIEIRSLKTRVMNGPEYQMSRYDEFQEAAIRLAGNDQQIVNMVDSLPTLTEKEIVSLARSASGDALEIRRECLNELARRVNLWISLRHRPGRDFDALVGYFFEVLAVAPEIKVESVLRFVSGFRDPNVLFRRLSSCLIRERRFVELMEIHRRIRSKAREPWRLSIQDGLVRIAALEGINIAAHFRPRRSPVTPLMLCWLHYHKAGVQPPLAIPQAPDSLLKENYSYGRNIALEKFFHDAFFTALAKALTGTAASSLLPVNSSGEPRWIDAAVDTLEQCARNVAAGGAQLSFSAPYFATEEMPPVIGERPSSTKATQYHAFTQALRHIAIDLHCLKSPAGRTPRIGKEEMEIARRSEHWNERVWISEQVQERLTLLDTESAEQTLLAAMASENDTVTEFNERADNWTELSKFALLYGLARTDELVFRAANCMVGYGWRKDLWLNDVLEAIADVHRKGAANGLGWLKLLTPIVEQITNFTDGDETDHIRSELINTLAVVAPTRLPDFYAHHISQDEHRYAEETLSAFSKLLDFSDPASAALAHTFVEPVDILTLARLRKEGDAVAGRLESDQIRFLGGVPPDRDTRSDGSNDDFLWGGTAPDITRYGPTEFATLLESVSDHTLGYELRRKALRDWLLYWKEKGKAADALGTLCSYFDSEENPYSAEDLLDTVFQVSLEVEGKQAAYRWLVMAQIHHRGWQSYWSSSEDNLRRLGWAATHYIDKWADFIQDTSKRTKYWEDRKYDFAIGTKYLVHFLLLAGQNELAVKFTDRCVRIVVEEVSDQPIPACPWFQ
ncbi:hypothetical protein [Pelagibius marinus]|uniref:hypothetical protein n=1 Tax=Pelagibius marinus TaxID=2762760 RepID=UPI0018730E65|nr:hypothetical protein [Pelagibius marinus]